MKVLVTGATGFTGSHTVSLLLQRGLEVTCFVRSTSDVSVLPRQQVKLAYGDLDDPPSLQRAMAGHDWLVNVASLGFGHAPTIVHAAQESGISRAVFVSTTAIFTTLSAASKEVRQAAERAIGESGLAFTIIRPTMIYGGPRDRNICRLVNYLRRWPALPVFGSGEWLQQPVYVDDVADAITTTLFTDAAVSRAYNIAGGSVVTYNQLVDTTARLLGRRVRRVHLPVRPIVAFLTLLERFSIPVPIKGEQVLRLNENKDFDYSEASRDLGYRPCSLEEGLGYEMRAMGLVS